MPSDESKMRKKLTEHEDMINLIVDIGRLNDIIVTPTTGNDSKGDFSYPKEKKETLINLIDNYLGKYKHRK